MGGGGGGEEAFEEACALVRSGALGALAVPTSLRLYGLYAVARRGPAPPAGPSPWLDPRGAAKWQAWAAASARGGNREEAMAEYAAVVEAIRAGGDGAEGERRGRGGGDGEGASGACCGQRVLSGFDEVAAGDDGGERREAPRLDLSHWASLGDVKSVRHVLDTEGTGVIDRMDEMGMTALMRAADRNEVAVLDLLLERGADIDEADGEGQTALHYAAFCGHVETALKLVDAGADLQKRDADGATALESATEEVRQAVEQFQNSKSCLSVPVRKDESDSLSWDRWRRSIWDRCERMTSPAIFCLALVGILAAYIASGYYRSSGSL